MFTPAAREGPEVRQVLTGTDAQNSVRVLSQRIPSALSRVNGGGVIQGCAVSVAGDREYVHFARPRADENPSTFIDGGTGGEHVVQEHCMPG